MVAGINIQIDTMQVLRQSYFFDSGVKTMGVSATMHGISNKFLLVGTLSDQVCLRSCSINQSLVAHRHSLGFAASVVS
jgi:hypothetical protein